VDERSLRIERRFEIPLLIAALLVIPVLIIQTSENSASLRAVGLALDWVIWGAFAAELVVMLCIVPNRRQWLRGHVLTLVIVVFTPPFLPLIIESARALLLLRMLQLGGLAHYSRRAFSLEGVAYAGVLVVVSVLGGGLVFAVEQPGVDGWLGIYWAATTMTTLGPGDVTATTTLTHILTVALSILGLGFTTLLTGAIAQRFLVPSIEEIEEQDDQGGQADERLLAEMQAISQRLASLEGRLER
jgi:voltage-gated potassium channel